MMQHQYWVTKKTVLKKLGNKEDDCIVSSDAELDAKLELFRSISDSCLQLQRVLDQYQERLVILAQEENALGKFLREAGKTPDAASKHKVAAGKAICYSSQQRLSIRSPLLRLYHEVETFRGRAVSDMRCTVTAMEKARTEYRAALGWMKSTGAQLDPDTGRGLDSFRKAQRQVRESKKLFDKLTLDVLQKIDLLAAARCNMFSHVLANYQSSFSTFSSKVAQTLLATADTMTANPQYEFSILKELSQNLGEDEVKKEDIVPQDKDQMLFFQDEYKDIDPADKQKSKATEPNNEDQLPADKPSELMPASSGNLIDTNTDCERGESSGLNSDLAGLRLGGESGFSSFMPSRLLQEFSMSNILTNPLSPSSSTANHLPNTANQLPNPANQLTNPAKPTPSKVTPNKEDKAAWFKLFAELDPLANPDSLPGSYTNQSHAA